MQKIAELRQLIRLATSYCSETAPGLNTTTAEMELVGDVTRMEYIIGAVWAEELIKNWGGAENLCAAHTAALLKSENQGDSIRKRLKNALRRVESTLASHQRKHG